MSKNLKKASDWIQRQIDVLKADLFAFNVQKQRLEENIAETTAQISELEQVLEKLPVEIEKPLV